MNKQYFYSGVVYKKDGENSFFHGLVTVENSNGEVNDIYKHIIKTQCEEKLVDTSQVSIQQFNNV